MHFGYSVVVLTSVLIACGAQPPARTTIEAPATESGTSPAAAEATPTDGVTRCGALMTRLCADLGPTTETCELVRVRTTELEERDCNAMSQHYTQVLAELVEYETRNQPLSPAKFGRMTDGATTTHGPANAPVTIVIFSDFQCPFCAGAAITTRDLVERYGERIRVVFRQFPLPFHHNAHAAAEASLAAHAQGKFWQMHDRLFANQGDLDRASLTQHAHAIGLHVGTFDAALDSNTYAQAVDSDLELGMELGVNATPTMFVNGARIPNAGDLDALVARIDALLGATSDGSAQP